MDLESFPPQLQEAIRTEAEVQGFGRSATRWLALLAQDDPTLPVPTAGAMVNRARELPIGEDLARLDEALHRLRDRDVDDLTTSERRVLTALLQDLRAAANELSRSIS